MKGLFLFISIFTNLMFLLSTPIMYTKIVMAFSAYVAIIATVFYVCFVLRKYYAIGFILITLMILFSFFIVCVLIVNMINGHLRSIG